MYKKNYSLIFSPSDLTQFVESPFASWMDHFSKAHPEKAPEADEADSMMTLLQEKGEVHEHQVLEGLRAQGLSVVDLSTAEDKAQATVDAMHSGAEVIFQACLEKAPFRGFSDFLVKVAGDSDLGNYHYEVWDTKLSKEVKPYFVIQLCCYEDMVAQIQGRRSEEMVVVLGNDIHERLRTDDYYFYYESVKHAFLAMHDGFDPDNHPHPANSTSWGNWGSYVKQLLIEQDHLSQVAKITRNQIKKFEDAGISTAHQLAEITAPNISGIQPAVLERLKAQAAIQIASAGKEVPEFIILPHEAGKRQGLALMPPHSDLDVFFDIEGCPLIDGGLEYLWGNTYFDGNGDKQFIDFWAHDAEQEKLCFQDFIRWIYARWIKDPSMHIYHYANYEIAACRKLMSRYGVCEYEVDQLLRNEVFVDLYKVVKGSILLGEPNYSIKSVEHIYRSKRETEVGNGGDSVVVYERWRENPDGLTWDTSKILNDIRDYNIDDCDSTQELVDWLRERQQEQGITYQGKTEVFEPELSEEVTDRTKLRDRLLDKSATFLAVKTDDNKEEMLRKSALHENLAWMLEFHRREAKPVFWRLFDRLGLSHTELIDDLDCLANCERTETEAYKLTARKKKQCFEYSFDPSQEFKLANASNFYLLGEEDENGNRPKVTLVKNDSDFINGVLVVEAMIEPPQIISLVPDEYINPAPIPQSIDAVVNAFESGQMGSSAILDFLERKTPNIQGLETGQAIVNSENALNDIVTAVIGLKSSYLPIQGPPGAGKTYTGKHVIAELLKLGKKVGICSNSHKAINNLLIGTAIHCQEQGISAYFACTKDTEPTLEQLDIAILKNPEIAGHLDRACVIGTTAWGFSRDDLADQFDYLFIDEAGQVSVANLIAISRSADNLILLGDQMQLGQPTQATHPADSGLSTLDYLLHESPTISADRGVFLDTTYRMHSAVNRFISNAVYEGKLHSHPGNDAQIVKRPADYSLVGKEAGVIIVDVEHEGNSQASDEEVAKILELTDEIIGRTFVAKDGSERLIDFSDILFVAPYNHQVNKLKLALGDDAQVGSVDKFQGQEAPIVILSMCASDANDSPRGLDFLFDKHRLNVAISRAQSLAIVVANPKLKYTKAKSIKHQRLLNTYCHLHSI
ncbi:MAG: TM0106 family RecB-like putative nuclease [Pseudomonadales bacterium]|nr:TM0106 family RecB-like putative nuclease [Pseudomonadales bacterium]